MSENRYRRDRPRPGARRCTVATAAFWLSPLVCFVVCGCGITGSQLAEEPPPLADMEEPLDLFDEPDDEAARRRLPPGTFTGVYVTDSRQSLDALLGDPEGVLVERVVENSPGDLAGIRDGDILLEAEVVGTGDPVELHWPSEWRDIELNGGDGDRVRVLYDRAATEIDTELTLMPRARPADRKPSQRFREENRVGVVVRTATEAEARAAALAPGAGAVIVGLSAASPWRAAGLQFGDLIVEIGGQPVAHPQILLDRIREAGKRDRLKLVYLRGDERRKVSVKVSRRVGHLTDFKIPLVFRYKHDRGKREISALLGLIDYESTAAAWRFRLLYLFRFGGGKADRLKEVDA